MATPMQYSVAFDCGKEEFAAAILLQNNEQSTVVKATRKFSNTLRGFSESEQWIERHKKFDLPVRITMEATGNYHEHLAFYFHQKAFRLSIVLPNKAKKYLQSLGQKSKNDKLDSIGLAKMGAQQNLFAWQPFSSSIYELRTLTRYYEQLSQHRTQLRNQLSSLRYNQYRMQEVEDRLSVLIKEIEKQLSEIKDKIEDAIKKDDKLNQRADNVLSIKGIGMLTVATVIAETNGFQLFDNQRQLCSYAGYDVVENQSGKRNGKTKISKKGNSHIRRIMYMPALNVVRCQNPKFVAMYERIMSRNTKKMVAYTAIQRKLLVLIYTLWTKNEKYSPDYKIAERIL